MHADRYGHGGPPIVLLHGFGTYSFLWRLVGPRLALARCMAFAVDLLGHGESDRPFDADFGIAAQAEYLDRAMTALRIDRATVVGVDVGGGVALRLAAVHPDRVDRLVLINTVAFDDFPGQDIRTLQRNTARVALSISTGVLGAKSLLEPLLLGSVAREESMPPRLVARYLAPFVGREGVGHLLSLARAIRADDLEELDLGAIRQPAMVVWGEDDRWLDPRIPDQLVNTLPESKLIRLPGVGRLVPEEAPDTLADMVLDFVGAAGTV